MFKLQKGKGQVQTDARFDALSCKRLATQQAVIIETKMGHLPDQNKYNVDGSVFLIESDGKGGTMYRFVSVKEATEWENKLLKNPLTSIRHQQGLDMGLKWMHLTNHVGDFGDMVLVVAVPGMPQGRFHCAKVQGLVFGEDSSKYGYVYFAQTRCMRGVTEDPQAIVDDRERPCNPWSHYFQGPFVESILKYMNAYNMIDPKTDERFEVCCTIDGEACIDRELLHPDVFEKLAAHKIGVIKNRPSGTQFDNTCDAADNFRDKNVGLQYVVKNNINTSNPFLEGKLAYAFAGMRAAFPEVTMTAAHQRQAINGMVRFSFVCRGKWVTSQKAVVGARRTFQARSPDTELLRPIFGHEESTVDSFRLLRHLCYSTFTDEELDNIHMHFPEMISIQKEKGRVTNVDLDRLGIAKLPEGEHKDRDALCLAQQGPLDLTHHETRVRETAYAQRKETAATQKEIDDARALVAKNKKKMDKAALVAAEKARVKKLTPEQKKTDPACILKAAQNKEKKEKTQQKRDAEAAKVAEATARVNAAT